MFVNFNILNQLGSPAINSNTFANRPAAGQTGRLFVSTDTFEIFRDNGTTWDLIGGPGTSTITGTGQATEVAFFTSSQAIASSANLFWDNTNQYLGIGTSVPNAGVNVQDVDALGVLSNITTVAGTSTSSVSVWAKNTTNLSGYAGIFEEITPNSAAGQYPIKISHTLSSGTAAANMATGIHFGLPDNTGTERINQLSIDTVDPIAATYSNRYRFLLRSNGAAVTPFYITGTGLGVFTATPGAALDIHSTGIMVQLNSTSATANSLLAFQRSGSGLWRIGDAYNGGNNYFELHNTVLTNNAIQVLASSNEATFLSSKTYSTGNAIGVAVQHNLTIPNAVNVGLAAIGGVNSNLNLTLGGSTTVAATGRQGLEGSTTISFTGAGTLTMTQGSTVRAFSALSSVYGFNGSAVGTITHLAGLRICFPDNPGSAVNITNNYALLINNQTTGTGTVTYTNRWGIYQEGASDLNYMAANLLLGSTVNTGDKLQVTGTTSMSGQLTVGINTLYVDTVFNRVGIGTLTPSTALNVMSPVNGSIGNVSITSSDNDASGLSFIVRNSPSDPINSRSWMIHNNYSAAGNLEFLSSTTATGFPTTTRMTLLGNGNVGIGTTNPIGKLEVNGDVILGGTLNSSWAVSVDNLGTTNANGMYVNIGASSTGVPFAVYKNFNSLFQVANSGNVGIGTSAPTSTLNVVSSAGEIAKFESSNFSTGGTYIQFTNTSGNVGYFGWGSSSNDDLYIYNQKNSNTTIWTNQIERVRVTAGGNVLINTQTDAGYKTDVAGSLRNTTDSYFNTTSGATHIGVTTGATASVPSGKASLIHSSSGTIFSYTGSFPNPYSQNIQIDIVYTNWGSNNVIGVVDLIVALREYNNTGGTAFGKVFATTTGAAATFSTFNTTDITTSQCTLAAASGGNFTLRITIDPSNNTDVYSIYMNVIEGGTGVSISSITVTLV